MNAKRLKNSPQTWTIIVRLRNGQRLHYRADTDWTPYANDAQAFGTREAAEMLANTFATNTHAIEYLVEPLKPSNT